MRCRYQVSGGKNWQAEFFGVLPESKVVVAMISKRYWRSTACIAELKAALLHKKPVIPLYLEEAPRKGHFLGESVEQIKVGCALPIARVLGFTAWRFQELLSFHVLGLLMAY